MSLRLGVWLLACTACGSAGAAAPMMGGLEARYRLAVRGQVEPVAATRVYRGFLASSLFSRCKMLPTDSQLFDRRARACGGLAATYLGSARLYLEAAADARFLRPVVHDGRLRWFDLPDPESCAP